VLGALLQHAGHDVRYWVRAARRSSFNSLCVARRGGEQIQIPAPQLLCIGDAVPPSDWVLVCVRGEQLTAALREVALHMGAERRVAIAAITLEPVTKRARAVGLNGPIYALHVSFAAFNAGQPPGRVEWFPFALPTTVTPDGDATAKAASQQLARTLARAGLPTRSALRMHTLMGFVSALTTVLALTWDLCAWRITRLAKDEPLRQLTARAMREATGSVAPDSVLRYLPVWVFAAFLRVLPRFIGARARAGWVEHGPKIRAQTETLTLEMLNMLGPSQRGASALQALFAKWQLAQRAPLSR
jgi:ketopantoate reductase